jgi:hypothetical protein
LCGISVSGDGDNNGVGFDDTLIGAHNARPNDIGEAGKNYIVFGNSTGFSAAINLADLDGADGFRLDGISRYDRSGRAVSAAGDINGDGVADYLILARNVDQSRGEIYVVFGKADSVVLSVPDCIHSLQSSSCED